jgi:hypothetical protein
VVTPFLSFNCGAKSPAKAIPPNVPGIYLSPFCFNVAFTIRPPLG